LRNVKNSVNNDIAVIGCLEPQWSWNFYDPESGNTMRIIVTGLIAQYPLGGVAWDYVQYVSGLKKLGHDVYYFEDTGQWPFNPEEGGTGKSCDFNVRYLDRIMQRFGLQDSWAYRFPWKSQWFGLTDSQRNKVIGSADILINISGTLAQPEQYRQIPNMVYIDSDPVFTQVKLGKGQIDFQRMVSLHDVHFTFGETLGSTVPKTDFSWIPTRQPILLSEWRPESTPGRSFTTVMNWTSYKPLSFSGKTYAQKDVEFKKFLDLPAQVKGIYLELAVNTGKTKRTPRALLSKMGWHVVHPDDVCPDLNSYRSYIQSSRAEWSVAKNGYVDCQSGWFSCRSACYLAAGRPVVVQDTGFSNVLPTGKGIVPFTNIEEAVEGILDIEERYDIHREAAREIAEQYFDSSIVLRELLDKV
jgi:hypothetical protein